MIPAAAVEGASLRLGAFALHDLDLRLATGEILVILGPNGAGKSVILEAIAGFHRLAAGRIAIGGRDVTALPPERRRVGFVVQNFGLFPHLSVADNIAFGLGPSATPGIVIAELLRQFGLAHLADRDPASLSPGEKQRVALARALATRPDLFLFDEPFSALDARSRALVRDELKAFLREARIPSIFVTHDQSDAFVLADQIAVMDRGRIVQTGTMADVHMRPANVRIAEIVGMENILGGRIEGTGETGWDVAIAGRRLRAVFGGAQPRAPGPVSLCIRAEEVRLRGAGDAGLAGANLLPGRVQSVTSLGPLARVALDCGFPLVAYALARDLRDRGIAPGAAVTAEIAPGAIHPLAQ
jgi:molybdate/tungstate transport system ATP-binding protein